MKIILIILTLTTPLFCFTVQAQFLSSQWEYINIDDKRDKWGDYNEPKFLRYFGVDMMHY